MVQSIFDEAAEERPEQESVAEPVSQPGIIPPPPAAEMVRLPGPQPTSFLSLGQYPPPEAPVTSPTAPTEEPLSYSLYTDPPRPAFVESAAETVRRSGLAWSAGVVFLGAVVFMLFLGWGADLILGTSPWGLVAGIVLGSTIGFIQFFRISSQIFPTEDHRSSGTSFISDDRGDDRRL
jgi:F0F1-type ATP synthase assembly protein I